jgi:dCTP diphosphatase
MHDEPSLTRLQHELQRFAEARDWGQFHSPKNLAMALVAEAGEVVEHFQWLTEQASMNLPEETRQEVELELADVLLYLLRLADVLNVDLPAAAWRKIAINAEKYPVEKARGRADKYHKL